MVLLVTIIQMLQMVINLYIWVVIIAALISWVRPDPYNPIVQTLYRLTEPVYAYIRRYIPTVIGGIDLAPIIVIFGLQFIELLLSNLLRSMWGWRLKAEGRRTSRDKLLFIAFVPFFIIGTLFSKEITLDFLNSKPKSIYKDYYIWRYLDQNVSSKIALKLLGDTKRVNSCLLYTSPSPRD